MPPCTSIAQPFCLLHPRLHADRYVCLHPQDPLLATHMKPILDELFGALQARAAGAAGAESATLRLVIHVVNSLRMQCN